MSLTGKPALRLEDERFLTGRATFVADIPADDALAAVVVRTTVARGNLRSLDVRAARSAPGVVAVFVADDIRVHVDPLPAIFHKVPLSLPALVGLELTGEPSQLLVDREVRRAGEPLAVVVAENRAAAENAARLVVADIEELTPLLDVVAAAAAGAEPVFGSTVDNVQARFTVAKGDAPGALRRAPRRLRHTFRIGRQVGSPVETRGVLARYDVHERRLTVWATSQHQHLLRNTIADLLHLAQDEVRVIVPDMGGSFGGGMYPEDILIPFIALHLGRPVRWIETRRENLSGTRHSRDQLHDVEVGFDDTGRILALQDVLLLDTGNHNFFGPILGYNTASHMIGQYEIDHYSVECRSIVTNKTPNSPVRGAGRFEATFVMDRLIDMVADVLSMDSADVRRRNLVPADSMPYDVGIPYRDGKPYVYDTGNFPLQLETALDAVGYERLRVEQAEMRAAGRCVGVGIGSYTEASGYGPFEGASVRIEPSGRVIVHSGGAPHGQSHQTMLTNVCADALCVPAERVMVRSSDTDLLPYGVGTFASRGAVTSGTAVHLAATAVRERLITAAARMLSVEPGALELDAGLVRVTGTDRILPYGAVSAALVPASPLGTALGPGLFAEEYFVPPSVTVASGTHVAIVEVDPATGQVSILRYVVVHDCGTALNPTVVHGQVRGGVAHGIGSTLMEEVLYDAHGMPTTLDLGSYPLVTAPDVPEIEVIDQDWPTPLNPLGAKGVGEGGAVGVPPALSNAIVDALRPLRISIDELPITAERLRSLIRAAETERG